MRDSNPPLTAVESSLDEETEIAVLAYRFYEEEGRPEGKAQEHWSRAEQEIQARTGATGLNKTQASQIFGNHAEEL